MKIEKIIELIDAIKPNVYGEEVKFRWLTELDGMVHRLVMQQVEQLEYTYPEDMGRELLIPPPWDGVYEAYLTAKIDFHNHDISNYNNAMQMFNSLFDDYKKAYIRENMPAGGGASQFVLMSQHPPVIGDNGNWMVWGDGKYVDSGKPSQGEAGPPGAPGPAYELTEADKQEIAADVLAALPAAEGVSF